ncbi:GIY-YIG nuclease family protein [Streptomyces sp. NPDC047972]|uniref:GIY-YIG nuclease family protein n=1 Tax=Streptomyces sp. NPDC047972 TaxID=3365493 RepID=UPI003712DA8B
MDQKDLTRPSATAASAPWRPPHATDRFDGPTILYRMYDAADLLLYIGITCNPAQRWDHHRTSSAWWPQAVRKELTTFPDRASALAAESAAILAEEPKHNITGNPRAGRRDIHLVLMGDRATALADLARAERLSINRFVMRLIDAALTEARPGDGDLNEALRRVRTERAGGAR